MIWEVLFIVLLVLHPLPSSGYGEPDSSGHPVYQERANHVFLNAVRIAPSQYKTVYMAGYSPSPSAILGTTYPAVAPLYMEPRLVASAYFHSNDLASHGCFQHPSCNGTDTFVRIRSFYSCSGTMGENIAAGLQDPLDTSNQWLCDQVNGACAADGSGSDGHRSNMMLSAYKAVGVGYAFNATSTYRYYWTQDFGGAVCSPVPTNPIYSGSHRVKSGRTKFIAVYYTTPAVAPSSATITIDGTTSPLTLDIGTDGRATYALNQTAGTACRSYFFSIGSSRYPDTGCLVTYGEGTCTTSFVSSCAASATVAATSASASATSASASTSATASTAAVTTAAVTTAAATTAAATTAAATTTTSASSAASTTGSGSTYFLFSSSIQNSWVIQKNSPVIVTSPFTYMSHTGFSATLLTTANNNFFWFFHDPAVANVWTTLQFNAAASSSGSITVFFNGNVAQTISVTTTWQLFSISFSSLRAPATLGNPSQLVFSNSGSATITLYLYNVAFV